MKRMSPAPDLMDIRVIEDDIKTSIGLDIELWQMMNNPEKRLYKRKLDRILTAIDNIKGKGWTQYD
jgi:hypothetical protein